MVPKAREHSARHCCHWNRDLTDGRSEIDIVRFVFAKYIRGGKKAILEVVRRLDHLQVRKAMEKS